ncbi:threonine--tRNA ligase [Hydrogenibacillus schlegelii]|uniref:Threonine--tRNA ligase n=1 Tax=Hydrogenibacillus schlegelii TaxID=1484 RepID=A0A179IQI4_HYDSH|nr:threonine--tRNA ligase [Hydrogenibacillus schlegelii]OAR04513.1 threonine--tRNA ligase [Hydrogenibacillus schlegelii]PTQ53623.1 MAG: Threonyl-tRNA synthetase [Hydrogenibacillus schlegelii]
MPTVVLPDGAKRAFPDARTAADVARAIGPSLAKRALAAEINGRVVDLSHPVAEGDAVRILTAEDEGGLLAMRHTAAHILAQAILRLYPGTKLGVGPVIEDGFYYDVDPPQPITADDLPRIEAEMKKIIAEDHPLIRQEVTREAAIRHYEAVGDPYKLELIAAIPEGEPITFYRQGEFVDLCRGPHVPSTGKVKAVKLLSVAGAYWRGDHRRPMLTRIYGTAWASEKDLEAYLARLEEARQRDHRRIGKELKFFTFSREVGQGLPLWLPNGAKVRRIIERYIVDLEESLGYQHVYTPVLANVELYEISGHYAHYKDNMYPPMELDHERLVLRPMNCPHHMMIYKSEPRSYRDLPLKIAELGTMFRYEASGALTGLHRVRGMTLNDAHIFVTPEQIESAFSEVVELILRVYRDFGIDDYWFRLSLRDPADTEKYVQNDAMWEMAEGMLRRALTDLGLDFVEAKGEAAFYGPKLDVQVKTALGKDETLSTVQLDFVLPERFDLTYVGEDGASHRPVVIHRGVVGTMERFVAYLLEKSKGALPVWLSPEQAVVLPVSDRFREAAEAVVRALQAAGVRVRFDARAESLNYRIRDAQVKKIPYTLVVGEREAESGTVAVRRRGEKAAETMSIEAFIALVKDDVAHRR